MLHLKCANCKVAALGAKVIGGCAGNVCCGTENVLPNGPLRPVPPRLPQRRTIALKPLPHNKFNDLRLQAIAMRADDWRRF